ncbi:MULTISPECIES: FAD-binding oxidoreductase [unclassified Roseofilum]|uniref:FAD-binding oxidoreductase n=1 Tax=unclassified Roseofilum TaxID=2620099 RepID=UPI001B065F8D|nr:MULTISPECIES: FAD-binding oxidoreductase [unclassified Roseofilum]MBP0011174.1 FAD-binding oxidoreductase [Roseofilum sp. Belize Diploria]MBP0035839.1 FAD-binding oxidoreductase [Roseofilum sp. Belize BBD 4]
MISPQLENHWNEFVSGLEDIEWTTQPNQVAKLSQDYFHFSPILQPLLGEKRADVVVLPLTEAQVLRVVKVCVKYKIPITVRGAGTGNYGQCVPLEGGVVLDLTRMNQILEIKPGWVRAEPGAKLAQINKLAAEIGWELRLLPSTYRTATLGGFIAGGSGGIGSILYGWLGDRGNVLAAKVVTLEDEPQVLELRGDDVQQVNHAYGTNGIIIELEMPLAPSYPWAEGIVVFSDFMEAARFSQQLGEADGLIAKLISLHAWPIPSYFTALKSYLPDRKHAVLIIFDYSSLVGVQALAQEFQGEITYISSTAEKSLNLGEFTWNHTTLHARTANPNLTYLQSRFPSDPKLELVQQFYEHYGEEVIMHLEIVRFQGQVAPCGLEVVKFTSEERLQEIMDDRENHGVSIFNPHTYVLEDGGSRTINPLQVNFKKKVDPYGLLNPGKMRGWLDQMNYSASR